jgi:hypothetical protein
MSLRDDIVQTCETALADCARDLIESTGDAGASIAGLADAGVALGRTLSLEDRRLDQEIRAKRGALTGSLRRVAEFVRDQSSRLQLQLEEEAAQDDLSPEDDDRERYRGEISRAERVLEALEVKTPA